MKKNIYLVGFMGTGKSTIGKQLARVTGRKFIDTDKELERRFEMSVNAIFEKKGEIFFREEEKKLAFELALQANMVVSAGGGTIMDPDTFETFKATGIMICLYADREELVMRLKRTNKRPTLKGADIEEKIHRLIEERDKIFTKIPIKVDTTNMTPREVVQKLMQLFKIRQNVLDKLQNQYINIS